MTDWSLALAVLPYALLIVSLLATGLIVSLLDALFSLGPTLLVIVLASSVWIFISRPDQWLTGFLLFALAAISVTIVFLLLWAAIEAYAIAKVGSKYWTRAGALASAWITRKTTAQAMEVSPASGRAAVRMLNRLPANKVTQEAWEKIKDWGEADTVRYARIAKQPGIPEQVWWSLATHPEEQVRLEVQRNPMAPDYARVAAAFWTPKR